MSTELIKPVDPYVFCHEAITKRLEALMNQERMKVGTSTESIPPEWNRPTDYKHPCPDGILSLIKSQPPIVLLPVTIKQLQEFMTKFY